MFDKQCFMKKFRINADTFLKKLLDNDFNRITTPFQIMNFKEKLQQNYFTSLQILYGEAIEDIIKFYLEDKGATFLPRDFIPEMDCDQIFQFENKVVLIEQKIRDDHDSSKKRGQVDNYNAKKNYLFSHFMDKEILSACWFIDDLFTKNRAYYFSELGKDLYYGSEIEKFFIQVFQDNRCKNFYTDLIDFAISMKQQFSGLDFSNLQINFLNFTPAQLNKLFSKEYLLKDIQNIFFNGKIPYLEILNWAKTKNKTVQNKQLIHFLEAKIGKEL